MQKNKPDCGFTLIELLIVIAILGILSGILIAVINPARQRQRAQDANLISALGKIGASVDAFYSAKAMFPSSALNCTSATCKLYEEIDNESHLSSSTLGLISFSITGVSTGEANRPIWYFGENYATTSLRGSLVAKTNIANSNEWFVWKSGQPIKVADLTCAKASLRTAINADLICNGGAAVTGCSTAVNCSVL